jgi:histidine ammonia-lyase
MGMTAASKLRRVVENIERVVAIELLAAAEGLEHRAPLRPGRGVRRAHEAVRSHAARLTRDRTLSADIERVAQALRRGEFDL